MPQQKTQEQEFMTVKQIAELFEVDLKTVRNWIMADKLPGAFKLPGSRPWIIPTASVEAYKKERDQGSNPIVKEAKDGIKKLATMLSS